MMHAHARLRQTVDRQTSELKSSEAIKVPSATSSAVAVYVTLTMANDDIDKQDA